MIGPSLPAADSHHRVTHHTTKQDALAGSSEVAQEALSSIRTVHAFAADQVRGRDAWMGWW